MASAGWRRGGGMKRGTLWGALRHRAWLPLGLLAVLASGCGGAEFTLPSPQHRAARMSYLQLGAWRPGARPAAIEGGAKVYEGRVVRLHRLASGPLVGLDKQGRVVTVAVGDAEAHEALIPITGGSPISTHRGKTSAAIQRELGPPERSNAAFDTYALYTDEGEFRGSVTFYCPAFWDSECRWMSIQWGTPEE